MSTESGRVIALRSNEAAKALGISVRTLWSLSAPYGPIPCHRLGHGKRQTILYPVAELEAWLTKRDGAAKGGDL